MTGIHLSNRSMPALVIAALTCLTGCSVSPSAPGEMLLPTITPPSTVASSPSPELPTHAPMPPTLTADEKHAYVMEMLTTNGGCDLPCWWGVTPGQSDWQGVVDYFVTRGDGFYFNLLSTQGLYHYYILHTFTERYGVVQSIEVRSESLDNTSSQFAQDWAHYSLDQVLSRYGEPSRARVALALPVEPGGPIYYILYIFYDNLGVGIRYTGPAVEQGELLHTCFSFESITLWLQSPESSTPLEQAISLDEWSFTVSLEEATRMSIEEFYKTFRHPGACLEAPPTFR